MPNDNPFQPLTFGDQVADQTGLIPRKTRPVVTPIFPVPDDAWSIDLYVHYKHGKPSAVWPYFDAEGKLVAFAARFDFIDSQGKPKKDVIPVCWCRVQWPTGRPKNEWQEIAVPEPRLLFNLRELILNPTAPVVFCEGEKKALIVPQRFPGYVGTTTMGGANAANLSEFSPLAGRSVTGWPDNDEAGHGYINDIAARATHAGASVKIVTVPPGLPPKWDIADDLPAGYTPEQMFEALRSAAPWQAPQPTDHEREDAELRQVSEMYPLPALDRPLSYARTATGEIWAHKEIEKKEGPEVLPVISPFTITARLRRIGARREAYSLRVRFQNRDGKSSEVDVPCGALAAMNGRNVMVELLDAGLRTDNKGDQEVIQILKAFNPDMEILLVQQPGWFFELPGCPDPVFVALCGAVFGAPEHVLIELDASMRLRPDVATAGTLEGWQGAVRCAVTALNVPHWIIGVCAVFAGVILSLTRMSSCGVNLSGHTSGGKTLTQEITASGWSTPDKHRPGSLLQMANNTENSIELAAKRATGTDLNLDELRLVSGKVLAQWIYMLAGGAGKKRMTVDVTLVDTVFWSVFMLMSSEHSLMDKIRGEGVEYDPGISVRVADVNVDGFNRSVDAETLSAISEIHRNYGHAGIAFVRRLVERGDHRQASEINRAILGAADRLVGGNGDPAIRRAAIPFAPLMISGTMAQEFGIIPVETDISTAIKFLWDRFRQSAEADVLEPAALMVRNLASWVAQGWDVTIKDVKAGSGVNNRDTWGWYDENAVYIPKSQIQNASGNVMKESQIGAALDRMGLLASTEKDRPYKRFVPSVGKVDAYALVRERFGRSNLQRDPDGIDDPIPGTSDGAGKEMSLRQLAEAQRLTLRRQKGSPRDRVWVEIDGRPQLTISEVVFALLKELGAPESQLTWPPILTEAAGK